MAVELAQVEAFLAVARHGGFTRAAAALHLSQPATSRRIHVLERELGAPLFERVSDGVLLTDAGRAFLPHVEAAVASVRDGVDAVGSVRGAAQGVVTLAIVGSLASTALTERLRRFREAHPAVDLRLRTALSAEVSDLVRRGEATLGLRYRLDPASGLVSRLLDDEPLLPVCAADHPLGGARRVEPAELAGERWLAFPSRQGTVREPYAATLEQWLAAGGLGGAEIVPVDSLTAQKRMVEAGFGLALLPSSSVDEELRSGALRVLPVDAPQPTIPIVLVHRRTAFLGGATTALIAQLAGRASPSPRAELRTGAGASPPGGGPAARTSG